MMTRFTNKVLGLILVLVAFGFAYHFTMRHCDRVYAAEDGDIWINEDMNILAIIPDGWEWSEEAHENVPVVFYPEGNDDAGVPDFVFLTYLGDQSGQDFASLKDEYIKAMEKDFTDFVLNSQEKVTTTEGLQAYDLMYTITEDENEILGYDRLIFTKDDIYWVVSFSAGKDDFKKLRGEALGIIDSFIFNAAGWLEKKQKSAAS